MSRTLLNELEPATIGISWNAERHRRELIGFSFYKAIDGPTVSCFCLARGGSYTPAKARSGRQPEVRLFRIGIVKSVAGTGSFVSSFSKSSTT